MQNCIRIFGAAGVRSISRIRESSYLPIYIFFQKCYNIS